MKKLIIPLIMIMLLSSCAAKKSETANVASPVEVIEVSDAESAYTRSEDELLDISVMKGDLAYSTVFDMMNNPETYIGRKVKMQGLFTAFLDEETGNQYFACIIPDATACCSQGIEFVWEGNHSWPEDYPELDDEITVEGTFETYYEDEYLYCHLVDADMSF